MSTQGSQAPWAAFIPVEAEARVLTLRQYADARHRHLVAKYPDTTLAEVRRLCSMAGERTDWWKYVEATVEVGTIPSTRLWRSLTDRQQVQLLRTHRALRDKTFTASLVAMTADPGSTVEVTR